MRFWLALVVVLMAASVARATEGQTQAEPPSDFAVTARLSCIDLLTAYGTERFSRIIAPAVEYIIEKDATLGSDGNIADYVLTECRLNEPANMGEAIEKLFDEKKHDQLPEIPIGGATDDPQDQANWDAFDKWIHHQGPAPHFRAAHSTPSDTAVSDITAKTNDSDSVSGECLHAQNDWKPYQTIKCYKRQQCPSQPTPSGGWMPCWGWKTYQIDYFIPEVQNLVQKTNNLIRDINNGKEIKIQDIEEIRKLFQQVHRTVSVRNVPNDFNYEFISVIDSILQQIHIDLARKMQIHEDKELESISIVEADPFHHPWIPIGTLISGPRTVAVEMQIPLWIDDNRMLAWVRHNAFGNWQANLFFFDCENSVYAVMTGLGFGSDQLPPKGSLLDLALRRIEKARAQKSPSLLDMERNLQVSSSLREVQRGTEESLSLQHLCH